MEEGERVAVESWGCVIGGWCERVVCVICVNEYEDSCWVMCCCCVPSLGVYVLFNLLELCGSLWGGVICRGGRGGKSATLWLRITVTGCDVLWSESAESRGLSLVWSARTR
jgi:hypothetical protein